MCPGFNLVYANNTGSLRYVHATLYYDDRSVKASALTFGAASSAGVIPRSSIGGEEAVSDMRVGRIDEQSSGAASATSVARPNMLRVYQQESVGRTLSGQHERRIPLDARQRRLLPPACKRS